ncbi:hypothetical protein GOP47_0004059 [Adiantum capillus-veneris]|uniref:Uncharacterized protein n=1 Tax=Adiantum capillus-veneris TaxID=13818 RepID=A0A9D4ZPD2_ADICA|nr:hypothetical protein GOP47_0004059 [Adiantum capillus-veneris]
MQDLKALQSSLHKRNSRENHGRSLQLLFRNCMHHLSRQTPCLFMLPLPHKHGDCHFMETLANVVTSFPFIFIGLQAPRKELASRMYANSIVGVGVASSLYHTSRGDIRRVFRWGDYVMISTSALCLTRALQKQKRDEQTKVNGPNGLILASAVMLPFKPSLVTAIHIGLTEASFYHQMSKKEKNGGGTLRRVHALSSILGCALFVADGLLPDVPFIHAAWHLAAAVGVATYTKLLH